MDQVYLFDYQILRDNSTNVVSSALDETNQIFSKNMKTLVPL